MINYTYLKSPGTSEYKYAQIFAKFVKPKCVLKTLKLCKFSFKAFVQKSTQNFFAEIVQSGSLCCRFSNKL